MHGKTPKFSSIVIALISYMKMRLNSTCDRKNAILSDELVFSDRNFYQQICNSKKKLWTFNHLHLNLRLNRVLQH